MKNNMIYSRRITEGKQNLGASLNIKSKARELRKNLTDQERILWSKLRKKQLNGMHFRRQHPYSIYILDFYCFEANLVIEVDGEIHLSKQEYDKERTRFLESSGLKVLRFKNEDIETRINSVIALINKYLVNTDPLPSLPGVKGVKSKLFPLGGNGKGGQNQYK
jgi:very-short-patch-repair endonuclease